MERDGHCAVFDSNRKKLLVFGGRDAEKKRLNDLFQCAQRRTGDLTFSRR